MSFFDRILGNSKPTAKDDATQFQESILDFAGKVPEQKDYATKHSGRLVRTLQLTPRGTAQDRILEMGAYMQITPALQIKLGYGEVRGSYLGKLGVVDEKSIESVSGQKFRCYIDLFNAETDIYPYPDEHFTCVICCELLEHLSDDPMHLMSEVNRIVKTGGHFILSTPNICALRSVANVLQGHNPGLYPQYIRPRDGGADPRHAREYTPSEIRLLFENSGFAVDVLETGPYGLESMPGNEWAAKILEQHNLPLELRDETIHIVGRKTGPVKERFPAWLYD